MALLHSKYDGTITIIQPRGPTVTLNITDSSLTDKKFATGSVTTRVLADGSVTGPKINQMGALTGQVLKWNGTVWQPANDDTTKIAAGTGIVITTDINGNNVISTTLVGLPPVFSDKPCVTTAPSGSLPRIYSTTEPVSVSIRPIPEPDSMSMAMSLSAALPVRQANSDFRSHR